METLLRRTNGTKTPKSLLSCFQTVRHFAEALDDDDDCGEMARRSLSIKPAMPHMKLLSGHVSLGSCAYLGGTLEELRNKSVYLINTETWLGLTLTLTLTLILTLALTLTLILTLALTLTLPLPLPLTPTLTPTLTSDADINGLSDWLGLDAPFKPLVKEHVGEFPHHRDELSPLARMG